MTIALASLPGAQNETGQGSCQFTWSGGGTWVLTSDDCTVGTATEPNYPGTTAGQVEYGTCSLLVDDPHYIHTLLQDPDGRIDEMVEKYHSQALSRLLCQNAAVVVNRGNGCIIHNYELMPSPKINQLVIPTGATRWSYCLLLADEDIKTRIYNACDDGETSLALVFGTPITGRQEKEHAITLTVKVLPPRRVSPYSDDSTLNNLWLIPVVDERYQWQYDHTGDLTGFMADSETDYSIPNNAVDVLLEQLEVEFLNVGVNDAYEDIKPTCLSTNDYENLPIVLDSILAHFGQRLVIDIGPWNRTSESYQDVSFEDPPSGQTRFATIDGLNSRDVFKNNLKGKLGLRACTWGSATSLTTSASSEVYTVGEPFIVAGGIGSTFDSYLTEEPKPYASVPKSVDIQTIAGTYVNKTPTPEYYKTIKAQAIWRTEFESEPADAMVSQIARDYYYQFFRQYDYTFAGIQPWQQGYFDDYMVYRQTWNPKTRQYDAYTRVCSRQPNMTGEWAGNPGLKIRPGIVGEEDGCNPGYYTVELAEWTGTHVEFDPEAVDPCPTYTVTGNGTTACAITLTEPSLQVTGTGVFVKAYDCAANRIPLKQNTMCLLTNLGHTVETGTSPNITTTPVWQIVRGRLNEEVYYEDVYDCCEGAGESGTETLISRIPSIVAAIRLPSINCGSC